MRDEGTEKMNDECEGGRVGARQSRYSCKAIELHLDAVLLLLADLGLGVGHVADLEDVLDLDDWRGPPAAISSM